MHDMIVSYFAANHLSVSRVDNLLDARTPRPGPPSRQFHRQTFALGNQTLTRGSKATKYHPKHMKLAAGNVFTRRKFVPPLQPSRVVPPRATPIQTLERVFTVPDGRICIQNTVVSS